MEMHPSVLGLNHIVIDAHGHEVGGSDVKGICPQIWHDLLSTFGKRLNRPAHLDKGW